MPPPAPPAPPPPPSSRKAETGAASKEENVYIPSFISKRPFYAGEEGDDNDYLKHQRREKKNEQSAWYDRGKKAGPAATKWRKGACENCGAMGHKARDCLERPRARGAKFTGKNIRADDLIQEVKMGWDAKRDRWNGYDPKEYRRVVEDFNQMEELRKQAQNKDAGDEEEDGGGDKYAEENDMSKHQSTATRQLRIREDTAKYLINLDTESAKYDPKTRTLVDGGATKDKSADLFAEENFMRSSGDAQAFERAQRFAWESQEATGNSSQHLQANPTAGEIYRKKAAEEEEKIRAERKKELEEKYGAQKEMPAALRSISVREADSFVEYDEAGLIKGAPRGKAKSKYPEDVLVNNHTSVWGSYWSDFKWGYACCHSFIKNSYCTGEDGKRAWAAAEQQRAGGNLTEGKPAEEEDEREKVADEDEKGDDGKKSGKENGSHKRTREEMLNGVTEAEMDEYRRKKTATNDPMAKFLGKDELIE